MGMCDIKELEQNLAAYKTIRGIRSREATKENVFITEGEKSDQERAMSE